jgi:hypothetical protein
MHFLTGMFANLTILKEKNEKVTNAARPILAWIRMIGLPWWETNFHL